MVDHRMDGRSYGKKTGTQIERQAKLKRGIGMVFGSWLYLFTVFGACTYDGTQVRMYILYKHNIHIYISNCNCLCS